MNERELLANERRRMRNMVRDMKHAWRDLLYDIGFCRLKVALQELRAVIKSSFSNTQEIYEEFEKLRKWTAKVTSTTLDDVLRPEVVYFALSMELRLRQTGWEDSWKNIAPVQLFGLLIDKLEGLANAMIEGPHQNVIEKAADVANYAMMIADHYQKEDNSC